MTTLTQKSILERIERFLKKNRISASAFGWNAMGDPSFVLDMRKNGRTPTLETIEKITTFIETYKREDA